MPHCWKSHVTAQISFTDWLSYLSQFVTIAIKPSIVIPWHMAMLRVSSSLFLAIHLWKNTAALTHCLLGNFSCFLFVFFEKFLQEYHMWSQIVRIQIRPDVLSGLVWVQTVCKGHQQMTLVGNELKVKSTIDHNLVSNDLWIILFQKVDAKHVKWAIRAVCVKIL